MTETFLTAPALRRRYAVSRTTIRRWIKDRLLPPPTVCIGDRPRWSMTTVEVFERQAGQLERA